MVLFEWIPKSKFFEMAFMPIAPSAFSSILLYNLPDALWFLSGVLFLRFLWFYNRKWQSIYIICFLTIHNTPLDKEAEKIVTAPRASV